MLLILCVGAEGAVGGFKMLLIFGLPFGRQSRCQTAPSNPLKAKMDGAGMGLEGLAAPLGASPSIEWNQSTRGHAAETAEPQQDSGPTACRLVGQSGAVWHLRTR